MQRIVNQAVVTDSSGATSGSGSTMQGDSILEVHTMAAVFYNPDSSEMDSMKRANREQFNTELEENKRLLAQDQAYLNQKNIKVLVTDKRYIAFTNNVGNPYIIDKKKAPHAWGLLLYDHEFAPHEADMKKVDLEYLQYFAK